MRSVFIFLFLLIPLVVQADPQESPLSITSKHFDCAAYKARIASQSTFGLNFIYNTFGRSYNCLTSVLDDPRLVSIEIDLVNETCVDRRQCGPYEILAGYNTQRFRHNIEVGNQNLKRKIKNAAHTICSLIDSVHHLRVDKEYIQRFLNPFLETRLNRKQFKIAAGWVAQACPNWLIVWNPVLGPAGKPAPPASISEAHGHWPVLDHNNCIVSRDGYTNPTDLSEWLQFFQRYKDCAVSYAWILADNCKSLGDKWKDPRTRNCPTSKGYASLQKAIRLFELNE